jgi:RNA 3'-terminal phosphate cyclase (ATP)
VAEARPGGSAGAVSLVLQCVLLPLAFARGRSTVKVLGGTYLPGSPPSDYVRDVWLPALARMGVEAELTIVRLGWHPAGQGEIHAAVRGRSGATPQALGDG